MNQFHLVPRNLQKGNYVLHLEEKKLIIKHLSTWTNLNIWIIMLLIEFPVKLNKEKHHTRIS